MTEEYSAWLYELEQLPLWQELFPKMKPDPDNWIDPYENGLEPEAALAADQSQIFDEKH